MTKISLVSVIKKVNASTAKELLAGETKLGAEVTFGEGGTVSQGIQSIIHGFMVDANPGVVTKKSDTDSFKALAAKVGQTFPVFNMEFTPDPAGKIVELAASAFANEVSIAVESTIAKNLPLKITTEAQQELAALTVISGYAHGQQPKKDETKVLLKDLLGLPTKAADITADQKKVLELALIMSKNLALPIKKLSDTISLYLTSTPSMWYVTENSQKVRLINRWAGRLKFSNADGSKSWEGDVTLKNLYEIFELRYKQVLFNDVRKKLVENDIAALKANPEAPIDVFGFDFDATDIFAIVFDKFKTDGDTKLYYTIQPSFTTIEAAGEYQNGVVFRKKVEQVSAPISAPVSA